MKQKLAKNNTGFTLIEALVYLALFGILMSGAIIAAYNLFESGARNSAKIIIQSEGDFLLSKVNWALSGISSINAPLVNTTGSQLLVTAVDPLIGSISIEQAGNNIVIIKSGITETLNNSNVTIENLTFDYHNKSGVEWITTSFTLNTKTADGKSLSQHFQGTKYIRK